MNNEVQLLLNDLLEYRCRKPYIYTHAYPNGDIFYVGKGIGKRAKDFYRRSAFHKRVLEKVGYENVLVGVYPTIDEKHALYGELFLIASLKKAGFRLCNLTNGGESNAGRVVTDEHRKKLSLAGTGFKKSPETLAKMRAANLGRKVSEATKEKMRGKKISEKPKEALLRSHIGKPLSAETKAKIGLANSNRVMSQEQKELLRIAHLGKKHKPEHTAKRAESLKKTWEKKRSMNYVQKLL
jgi:hypothetical protein